MGKKRRMRRNSRNNIKTNNSKIIIISLVLIILILLIGIFFSYNYLKNNDNSNKVNKTNYETETEKITHISKEDRQKAINKIVEEGMININYQSIASFENNVSTSFKVTNIENNKKPIKFKIIDENQNIVYESDEIKPGYECKQIKLDDDFNHEKGTFDWEILIGYSEDSNVSSAFPLKVTFK